MKLCAFLVAPAFMAGPVFALEETMKLSPRWEYVADTVMGGVSQGAIRSETVMNRPATRLTGQVSLENNGGFVQMAFDFAEGGRNFDASAWTGIEIDIRGNGEIYELRLKTDQITRPWQSFRTAFNAPFEWRTLRFAFAELQPYRTEAAFYPARLRRLGVVAVGREFEADVAVSAIRLYR